MLLNVSTANSNYFENKENLKQTAQKILKKAGAKDIEIETIFNKSYNVSFDTFVNPNTETLKAYAQIKLNDKIKNTLKNLKNNVNKTAQQKAVFGEVWNEFNNEQTIKAENIKALFEMEINLDNNIFAA